MPHAAKRACPGLILRIEPSDHGGGIVGNQCIGEAVHRCTNHCRHRVVATRDIKPYGPQPVVHIGQQAEVAVPRDAPRHVPQLFPYAGCIHVKDDRRERAGPLRARSKSRHPPVLGRNNDILFHHGYPSRSHAHNFQPARRWMQPCARTAIVNPSLGRKWTMPNTTQIDQVLADVTSEVRVPGVVAAAADASGTIYEKAFGRRSLASQQPMTTDTVFRIASMTKAVTAAAAMQMVEQGRLSLDQPAGEILPVLAEPKVLDGFDSAGKPVLRPARGRITLRNLLTHTAGFVYDTWNEQMNRFARVTGLPAARTGKLEALSAPLGHDPDQCWEYGINIDMAGRMVEV